MSLRLPSLEPASACMAAASAFGGAFAAARDIVLEVVGVPLPVLLAGACGAFGARAFLPETGFWRGLGISLVWMLAGGWTAELGRWAIEYATAKAVPGAALAGIALIIAAFGQRAAPILWEKGGAALERWLDALQNNAGGPPRG